MDIGLNHLHKLVLAGKPSAIIAFLLQNAPEALHRAVINAMRYAGHTLRYWRPAEIASKGPARKANCGAKEKAITEFFQILYTEQ